MHAGLTSLVLCGLLLAGACTPGRTGGADGSVGDDAGAPCPTAAGALGEVCACDDACGGGAPRCERDRLLEPEGTSYCTLDCSVDESVCPLGYQCSEGAASRGLPFCARCVSTEPGVVPLFEACLCDADCEPGSGGALTECVEGSCRITTCLVADPSSCPEGHGCETGPGFSTFCAECLALDVGIVALGESCGCSRECAADLVCRRGACRASCEIDEQCGALSCLHETGATASCQPPILDCLADGSARPGAACECNADCGPDAPFCLLGALGGVPVNRCATTCTPDAGECPAGTQCCGADLLLAPTCLADDLVLALGGTVQCAG